ncbi:transposase [Pseudoxanthomonas spadix BD-a59]|uniref:Transposase n=1 Tax=Pseudoxanthomonas spadix (strain BD-a59) TaxID=1045855 RepID=G7UR30_PSEUP|nr:IS110 family transposase [Pseudoxanthomonas spadix]AER55841.1 transposase [Pseudoxanthomonas spadix BD-a59]
MSLTLVGIDVAKATLAVCVLPHQLHLTLPNTSAGHAQLLAPLKGHSVDNLLLEATGGYERALMRVLSKAGLPVTRINPRQVRQGRHHRLHAGAAHPPQRHGQRPN